MCLYFKVVGLVLISSSDNGVEGSEHTEDAETELGGLAEVKYCNFLFQVNFKNNNNSGAPRAREARAWEKPHS